ncbi:MAG TPA: hypothetical protein DCL61_26145, partial [Cyanobacteria bacterium UBA12227]|nr:hypothetical protein [Cyanobacteria bacterium UBA12227]
AIVIKKMDVWCIRILLRTFSTDANWLGNPNPVVVNWHFVNPFYFITEERRQNIEGSRAAGTPHPEVEGFSQGAHR